MEWQVPEMVIVVRINQEKITRSERRISSAKSKSAKSMRPKEDEESTSNKKGYTSATNTVVTRSSMVDNVIPITAYYDSHGHLAEIAIMTCPSALHRKVIQAISLCVPFHSFLTKLVIRKGCLDYLLLHEISKLLPHSNITDVCLDDTYIPEGNYYVLLDQASNIKYLSLNRCRINDDVCKEIAFRIDFGQPAGKSLLALDLSSNKITDTGAKYFGDTLKKNRHLLHLNLLGNRISDVGFGYLLRHLQEFPLTCDEISDKKRRKMEYTIKKKEVYERCLDELARMQKADELCSMLSDKRSSLTNKHTKFKKAKKSTPQVTEQLSQTNIAEKMTHEIVGDLDDPYEDDNLIKKDNYYYSTGNLKLCSLNVAYNNIEFPSLLRVLEVLKYQCLLEKRPPNTGLMRIVLEGNYLPNACPELAHIDMFLKKAGVSHNSVPVQHSGSGKRRPSGLISRHRI
ncbi:uncharacterized protein LOC114365445 [Ostrinia furnacalis]|uniref:uncharacterized protein LOC114365445 n=1 Tax=Ostrinia furnacalis TaxID=93504 RepID=UPI0010393921|nr:uncharacterized protein LOC114365445 [Ostrinia furnacalis]